MSVFTTPDPEIICDCDSYVLYCTGFNRYFCDECHWNSGCRGAQKHAIVCANCLEEEYAPNLEYNKYVGMVCRNCL